MNIRVLDFLHYYQGFIQYEETQTCFLLPIDPESSIRSHPLACKFGHYITNISTKEATDLK